MMSCQLVSDESINHIVNLASGHIHEHTFVSAYDDCNSRDDLGRRLIAMNDRAYCARYPDSTPRPIESIVWRYKLVKSNRIEAYKALQCFLYQCREGNVDKSALFAEMLDLQNRIAGAIVAALPEYEQAPWG